MRDFKQAFSLAEILITITLVGVLTVLSINMLVQTPSSPSKWGRVAYDLVTHLESACNSVKLSYGTGPLNARKISTTLTGSHQYEYVYVNASGSTEDPDGYVSPTYTAKCALHTDTATADGIQDTYICNNTARGMSEFLPSWEGTAKGFSSPSRMEYPNGIVLYTKPDESTVPANTEIPDDGADTTPASFSHDDIMDTTDDRNWVLLDMNGTNGPNSITASGDRILLYVDDDSCKVLTARQQCKLVNSTGVCNDNATITTYPQSFLDSYKNYCSDFSAANCPFP